MKARFDRARDPEAQLAIECARATVEPERAERIRRLVRGPLDWERLLAIAQRNGVAPLLFYHLNAIGALSIPPDTLSALRDYFQKNRAFSLLFAGELARLLARLHDDGIEAVPFKGPALAQRLYGDVALRQFCDLDILVRERDVWRASEQLVALGFEADFQVPENRRAAFLRQEYVHSFRRDAGRTVVELHWRIAPPFFGVPFDVDAMWPRLEPLDLLGSRVLMPPAADLLFMLTVHAARHGWNKLEGLASIAELLRREDLDWPAIHRRSRELHCERMLALGLILTHSLFDVRLPSPIDVLARSAAQQHIAERTLRQMFSDDGPSSSFVRQFAYDLRLKDSTVDRVRSCIRFILTPTPADLTTMNLDGSLPFAYPLWRAARVARKFGSFSAFNAAGPRGAND